jgi:hypothetical protein
MKTDPTPPAHAQLLSLAAVVLGAGAAIPTGSALGEWVIFGDGSFAAALTRHWIAIPGVLALGIALTVWLRSSKRVVRLALPVLILALVGLSAWQGVSARIEAWRQGPLNAML